MKYFERLHPVSAFVYFITVLLVAMLTMHPVIVEICFLTGIGFCGMLIGLRKLLASFAYTLPILLLFTLTNPIFVHKGETILFFLNGRPFTLEALLYGGVSAMMLLSVFYWCRCYTEIMTEDKFLYLFGKALPKLSMVLTMTLAFVPRMKRKWQSIDEAQSGLGIYKADSYWDQIKGKFRVLSVLLTDCLEASVDTADSMRARGYGLPGRSNSRVCRFTLSDGLYLLFTLLFGIGCIVLIGMGTAEFQYYPSASEPETGWISCVLYGVLTVFAGGPIFMEVKENIQWHYLRSKI